MTTKKFSVFSSDGVSVYTVVIERNGNDLFVACDCKAGSLGEWCRHKGRLLNGDEAILAVKDDLTEVLEWVRISPVQAAISHIQDLENQQREADALLRKTKKHLMAARKAAAYLINPNGNK